MKKLLIAFPVSILLFACGQDDEITNDHNVESLEQSSDRSEEELDVEEQAPPTADFIKGTWAKVAQGCDSDGNNCDYSEGSDWVFDGENVTLGRVSQPYTVSNDTIYIAESPYRIANEMGDTILLNGIKKDRYMKLVRK